MKWRRVPLSKTLILADPGVWGPEDDKSGVSVLRSTNFNNDGTLDLDRITLRFVPNRKRTEKILAPGDIVLERSGGGPKQPVGRVCYFPGDDRLHCFGSFCQRFRANTALCHARYLFWHLHWLYVSGKTVQLQKQTHGIRNLEYRQYIAQEIPLPPLSEQRRIVEILDQADALRKKRAEADAKASRILPALFYKMFGDPATNPKGWPVKPIGEQIEDVERRDPSAQPEEFFTYIDIAGVNGQIGVITDAKTLMGAEAPSRARQIVKANDVIISTVRPYLRATALVPIQYDNQICSTGFCVLRAKAGIGFGFLYALSRLQWFTDQLNARARGASYPAVTNADVFNLRVPQPNDLDIHKSFDKRVLDVLLQQEKRREVADKIDNLFEILLHRAFAGDLTAKWREAHMKELLQEMEAQARELGLEDAKG